MKVNRPVNSSLMAFTLLEMTIVIGVLLALITIGMSVSSRMDGWKRGRQASETLREVYSAQRMFLSDNPTKKVTELTKEEILPYIRGNPTSLPTVKSLKGDSLTIDITKSPPVIDSGSGSAYDPSGKPDDSLWDVGK